MDGKKVFPKMAKAWPRSDPMKRLTPMLLVLLAARPGAASTLETVRARHTLACGVVSEAQDWNKEDLHGDLSALGSEVCRAVAVAALGRADAARITAYPAEPEALAGLAGGKVDVLAGVTPSVSRALRDGIAFGPPIFWDTQTFMVHRALGVAGAAGLAGRTVCFIDGTDTGAVLLAAMRAQGVRIVPFPFQEEGEMEAGLVGGHCAAIGAYASRLAGMRARFHALVHDFVLLGDVLAVSPASVATRQPDAAWSALVGATVDALGVTRASVTARRDGGDPNAARLLGSDWSAGRALGLAPDWSARVVGAVGNYGEIFARTLGPAAPPGLARGLNAPCSAGGAVCTAPLR